MAMVRTDFMAMACCVARSVVDVETVREFHSHFDAKGISGLRLSCALLSCSALHNWSVLFFDRLLHRCWLQRLTQYIFSIKNIIFYKNTSFLQKIEFLYRKLKDTILTNRSEGFARTAYFFPGARGRGGPTPGEIVVLQLFQRNVSS